MDNDKYEVVKDIPEGWDCGASVGDVLVVQYWGGAGCGAWTLMKDGKAVCDVDSSYGRECCKLIS